MEELGLVWWIMIVGALLVKCPLYGVHVWLPKAHVEAPVVGSIMLAAVMLKLGTFGLLRFCDHGQIFVRVLAPWIFGFAG